jgi:hypothetical protein
MHAPAPGVSPATGKRAHVAAAFRAKRRRERPTLAAAGPRNCVQCNGRRGTGKRPAPYLRPVAGDAERYGGLFLRLSNKVEPHRAVSFGSDDIRYSVRGVPWQFRSAMGERHCTSRGPLAESSSYGKHGHCRVPVDAVVDDRRSVLLQASGSDEMHQRPPEPRRDGRFARRIDRGRWTRPVGTAGLSRLL